MANDGMMRRGAATDLMEQVGAALAAPWVASDAGEKPICWSPEKGVWTKKKQVSQVRSEKSSESRCDLPLWQCPGRHAPRDRGLGGRAHLAPWS